MNSNYKGELRLADGTPVGKVVDWHMECNDLFEVPKPDFRGMFKPIEGKIEGTFTSGDGLNAFIKSVYAEAGKEITVECYISKQTLWAFQYLAQGKRYPSPKKRKSQARMSRKWRGRT